MGGRIFRSDRGRRSVYRRATQGLVHRAAGAEVDTAVEPRDNPAMARPARPTLVKMICGMISSRKELFETAAARLTDAFGPADVISEIMPFDFTHYDDEQMGEPLYRRLVGFERLRSPDELVTIKLRTNELEKEIAKQNKVGQTRPINLDTS